MNYTIQQRENPVPDTSLFMRYTGRYCQYNPPDLSAKNAGVAQALTKRMRYDISGTKGAELSMGFSLYPATERQKQFVALAGELADTFAKRASENEWAGRFPYENYR